MADLSVAIVSFNTRLHLQRCLDALETAATGIPLEIIVVDNGSTDGSLELLASRGGNLTVIQNESNQGFAAANNIAITRATAPLVLLLNSDAFITPAVLQQALSLLADNPRIGIVGGRLLNLDGSVQAGPGVFPSFWDDVKDSLGLDQILQRRVLPTESAHPVDWVQGACMFARMNAIRDVGGLDERFFMYSEEVDWCHRFWDCGWEVWYLPYADVVHIGGASSNNDLRRRIALYRSRLGLRRKMGGPAASALLWVLMLGGLSARLVLRPIAQLVRRHPIGSRSAGSDLALLSALLRVDPLARWAVS
jgi:GT2 family glycosyltransferase